MLDLAAATRGQHWEAVLKRVTAWEVEAEDLLMVGAWLS